MKALLDIDLSVNCVRFGSEPNYEEWKRDLGLERVQVLFCSEPNYEEWKLNQIFVDLVNP